MTPSSILKTYRGRIRPPSDSRPVTIRATPKQSTSPARNAAVITRMRVLRAVISDPAACYKRSQAGGDPCDDHLVEHRGAVVGPERWNVSLRLAVAPAWPAEPVGVAQPATRRMQAGTPLVLVACSRARHAA